MGTKYCRWQPIALNSTTFPCHFSSSFLHSESYPVHLSRKKDLNTPTDINLIDFFFIPLQKFSAVFGLFAGSPLWSWKFGMWRQIWTKMWIPTFMNPHEFVFKRIVLNENFGRIFVLIVRMEFSCAMGPFLKEHRNVHENYPNFFSIPNWCGSKVRPNFRGQKLPT